MTTAASSSSGSSLLPDNSQLILASSSPYRKELLSRLRLPFVTQSPDIDESQRAGESALAYVQRLAVEKATAVASQHPRAWVIGSDQCAVLNDTILGKPLTKERAIEQLAACSGQEVQFLTAYCLQIPDSSPNLDVDITTVHFRHLSATEIKHYVEQENVLQCAGSFKVESYGITLFKSVSSTDPTALIGLPLIGLCEQLRKAGAQLP